MKIANWLHNMNDMCESTKLFGARIRKEFGERIMTNCEPVSGLQQRGKGNGRKWKE
jgi:hypothetical protein